MNCADYLVILITEMKTDYEGPFVEKFIGTTNFDDLLLINNDKWLFFLTNKDECFVGTSDGKINRFSIKPNGQEGPKVSEVKLESTGDLSFVMMNQHKWSVAVKELINYIKCIGKNNVVWTHITYGVECNKVEEAISTVFCEPFSHDGRSDVEKFMSNVVKGKEYDKEIEVLIDKSLRYKDEKKGEVFEIIPTLSILCQGYLVVCAESKEKDKYWNDIEPALEEMGWVGETGNRVIDKGNSLIREDLKGEWGKVQLSNWWYEEVFTEDKNYSSINWDELRNKIANECKQDNFNDIHEDIRILFNDIATKDKRIEPPTVAKAYSAIAKVLAEST
jgi:hypothetical protein